MVRPRARHIIVPIVEATCLHGGIGPPLDVTPAYLFASDFAKRTEMTALRRMAVIPTVQFTHQ